MQGYDIAFARLGYFMPFLHITFVIFFVGFQAGFWFLFRYFLDENSKAKFYAKTLNVLRNFIVAIFVFLALIAITGLLIGQSDELKSADPMANAILATKYTLCGFLALNTAYMFYCYTKALRAFRGDEMIECFENILVIARYFMPLNLVISLVATYLGVAYRGF